MDDTGGRPQGGVKGGHNRGKGRPCEALDPGEPGIQGPIGSWTPDQLIEMDRKFCEAMRCVHPQIENSPTKKP